MAKLFISYNRNDRTVAEALFSHLHARGIESVFLDVDPAGGPEPGEDWHRRLVLELRRATALVYLCSSHANASKWCFAELVHALALGCRIYPLRVEDCPLPDLIANLQGIDAWEDSEEAFGRLLTSLDSAGVTAMLQDAWDGTRSPYPGFEPFDVRDSAMFFGRDSEIAALERMLTRLRRADGGLAQVIGVSGSGKSSVVRAGVMPRLVQDSEAWMVLEPAVAGPQLLDDLTDALLDLADGDSNFTELRALLSAPADAAAEALSSFLRSVRRRRDQRHACAFWFVDQAERLLVPGEAQARALAFIRRCAESSGLPLRICVALRADQQDAWEANLPLDCAESFRLQPLRRERLAEIIEGPAANVPLTLGPGLVNALVADTEKSGGLPLLAFALRELWDRYGSSGGEITLDDYVAGIGGLEGSIGRTVNGIVARVQPGDDNSTTLYATLGRMARLGDNDVFMTQPLSLEEVPASVRPTIDALVDAHLLVISRGNLLEPAHEIIFSAWPALSAWLADDLAFLRFRRQLAVQLEQWRVTDRDSELVHLSGLMLTQAEGWLEQRAGSFATDEVAFIEASAERARALAAEETRTLQLSLARGLAAQAQLITMSEAPRLTERGLLLAIEAVHRFRMFGERSLEADQAIRQATSILGKRYAERTAASIGPHAVDLAPDDPAVAYGDDTGCVRLWNPDKENDGPDPACLELPGAVRTLGFSRDARWLCAGDGDGNCRIFDRTDGSIASVEVASPITAICFDTGSSVVAVAAGGVVSVCDPTRPDEVVSVEHGAGTPIVSLAFDPRDSGTLATQAHMGETTVWRWRERKVVERLGNQSDHVSFSPDGRFLAIGSASMFEAYLYDVYEKQAHRLATNAARVRFNHDGTLVGIASPEHFVRLYRLPERTVAQTFRHNTEVWDLDFSRDGRYLLAKGKDDVAYVWEIASGQETARLLHAEHLVSARFLGDSRGVLTLSGAGTLTLWNTRDLREIRCLEHQVAVLGVAFDEREGLVATQARQSQSEGSCMLIDWQTYQPVMQHTLANGAAVDGMTHAAQLVEAHQAATAGEVTSPDGASVAQAEGGLVRVSTPGEDEDDPRALQHEGDIRRMVFSPDSRYLATASKHDTARIWDVRTGQEVARLTHHHPDVTDVDFSPDGRYVATSSWDHTARIWLWRPEDLIEAACTRLSRELTPEEWAQYLPDDEYQPIVQRAMPND